jgi:hypothetical protein
VSTVAGSDITGQPPEAVPADRIVAPMSDAMVERIIEAVVLDGLSAREVARQEGITHPRVLRLLKRESARVRELRQRENARLRQQAQRDRDRALAEAGTPRPRADRRANGSVYHDASGEPIRFAGQRDRKGDVYADLYLDQAGEWRRAATVGIAAYATAQDWERRGVDPPASFTASRPFGPPGHPRPPLGAVEPTVRLILPVGVGPNANGTVEKLSPIPAREVDALLAAGATPA